MVDLAGRQGRSGSGAGRLDYGYRVRPSRPATWSSAPRFALGPGDREAGRATIREIVRWRREHQPGGQNAGSVFTNPRRRARPAPRPGG